MRRALTPTQTNCINSLTRSFRQGERSAILQLPTGQGKSRVSVTVFKRLQVELGLKLLLVTPSRRYLSRGWNQALGLEDDDQWATGRPRNLFGARKANVCRISLNQLSAFLMRGKHATEEWQQWLKRRRAFVVMDEFHHNRALRSRFADALESGDYALPSWMRIRPGRPARGPLWLLLSATPYNPVNLDFQLDSTGADRRAEPDADEAREKLVLVREVQETLAFAARLGGVRDASASIAAYTRGLHELLVDGRGVTTESRIKPPLPIVPIDVAALRPRRIPSLSVRVPSLSVEGVRTAVHQVRHVHSRLGASATPAVAASMIERLVLSGVRKGRGGLEGQDYGVRTVRAVSTAQLTRKEVTPKLAALGGLARSLRNDGEKLLVFCTHRAAAERVRRHLVGLPNVEPGDVLVATSASKHSDARDFAEKFCREGAPYILVATEAFSESVDLHTHCRHLAHFELPWSPLRVLQRFGRLWRLRESGKSPAPVAVHFVHPGSVEEEILNRLKRRWRYLEALGLGYLDLEAAIGRRLPQVSW